MRGKRDFCRDAVARNQQLNDLGCSEVFTERVNQIAGADQALCSNRENWAWFDSYLSADKLKSELLTVLETLANWDYAVES